MAKIFFNDKLIKHTTDLIILNWFSQADGKTIFVRDLRPEIYSGIDHIYGDIQCYQSFNEDYYVDIVESPVQDGNTVLGLYIGEGTKFNVDSTGMHGAPIFFIKERAFEAGLGMLPSTSRGQKDQVVGMGLFYLGAEISIFKGDARITDKLTKTGWERIRGPKDIALGIKTTAEAFENRDKREKRTDLKAIEAAVKDKVIDPSVLDTFQRREKARERGASDGMFIFLKSDIMKLKAGNYI